MHAMFADLHERIYIHFKTEITQQIFIIFVVAGGRALFVLLVIITIEVRQEIDWRLIIISNHHLIISPFRLCGRVGSVATGRDLLGEGGDLWLP